MNDICDTEANEIETLAENGTGPETPTQNPAPTDLRTVAFSRAAQVLGMSALVTMTERGLISRADALGTIDRARAFATVDPDIDGAWKAACVVLHDSRSALEIVFAEQQAIAIGACTATVN